MNEEKIIHKINRLEFESTKKIKSLQVIRPGMAFNEFCVNAKSKPARINVKFEKGLKENFREKEKKQSDSAGGIRRVPLLDLNVLDRSARGNTTNRSYLNSYQNKVRKKSTPSARKNAEPEVFLWARAIGIAGDLKKEIQSGVAICEIVNFLEGRNVVKGFVKPVKSMKVAKRNWQIVETVLKEFGFKSNFLDLSELLSGSDFYMTGLLEDLKSFYDHIKKLQEKSSTQVLSKKIKSFIESLGFSESSLKPCNFGQFLLSLLQKLFLITLPQHDTSNTVENSFKNLELAFSLISTISPSLTQKYSKLVNQILSSELVLISFLTDLMQVSSQSSPFCDSTLIVSWLRSLDLIGKNQGFYDIVPKCKTGLFFVQLVEKVTGECQGWQETKRASGNSLAELRKVFDLLFAYQMVAGVHENVLGRISQADTFAIMNVLNQIKEKCIYLPIYESQPKEFNEKSKSFRSVTPPKSILNISLNN